MVKAVQMNENKPRVPVVLVTGFLGCGKTTLLNKIIAENPELKISLILNEFGDVKLESQFIEKRGIQVAELANGCMCCVAKSDVPRVVELVIAEQPRLDYIVIEASGLSDPDPIHEVLEGERLGGKVKLLRVVGVVDGVNFEKTRNEHQIVMSQIADSDTILISKTEEAGEEETVRIETMLKRITFNTQVWRFDRQFEPRVLLADHEPSKAVVAGGKHEHYDEYWWKTEHPLKREGLVQALSNLPESVVRAKGFVNCEGEKYLVQYSMGKLELIPDEWGEEKPATAILFLGKKLETAKLKQLWEKLK